MRSSTLFSIAILVFSCWLFPYRVNARQLSPKRLSESGYLWNPALTALGAPGKRVPVISSNGYSFQVHEHTVCIWSGSFVELNMSAGLVAFMIRAGPFYRQRAGVVCPIRSRPVFLKDQLSIGISGKASRMRFFDANQVGLMMREMICCPEDLSGECVLVWCGFLHQSQYV